MKGILYIIALIPFLTISAQDTMPGGVKGVSIWEITETSQHGMSRFRSVLQDTRNHGFNVTGKTKSINNNHALYFSEGANSLNSTLDLGRVQSFSMFTVCQETDTTIEKIIVSLENDSAAEMLFTNRRMAAIDLYRYASYNKGINLFPRIYSYTQNKLSDTGTVARKLRLGRPPRGQHLPASVYKGIIPEIILFNRTVSQKERQQVESYLAIKYGISLNQEFPVSYLDSDGDIIWDAEKNASFNSNIAGIGRDDVSGLRQTISESTQTPGLVKIGFLGEMKNKTFMIWGSNTRPLSFSEESGIRKLMRDWKISPFNSMNDSVFIEMDKMALSEIKPLRDGEIFWLMKDRSGTGRYPPGQTDFIPCQYLVPANNIFFFKPVIIDPDHSGSDVFTIAAAPPFFALTSIKPPSCLQAKSGELDTGITGGDPPFDIVLSGISDSRFHMNCRKFEREHTFKGLTQGAYILTVTDSRNKTYSEKIWIANSSSWDTKLSPVYTIPEGDVIALNASEGMPLAGLSYSWIFPDGTQVNSEIIIISQPGDYLLSVTDPYNCNSTVEIKIKQSGKSDFRMVDLFPNPVKGLFTLRIMLDRELNINVLITDSNGKMLKQVPLRNERFYNYSDIIELPGIYFITLLSDTEKLTLKLIVQ